MLTVSDIIHLIQYYYHTSTFATAITDVETLRLESLRGKPFLEKSAHMSDPLSSDIERALGVNTPPLLWASPDESLYEAASLLIQTHARRLPLLDNDTETGHEMIVSIMTQYRLLKFISINVCFPFPLTNTKALIPIVSP
jgi:5'-AMP-activated protein kinase, regulatory gamma subunit